MPVNSIDSLSESACRSIGRQMNSLHADVGAVGVLLIDPTGQVLAECGARGEFDTKTYLFLLGRAMASLGRASALLNDPDAFDVHIHEDNRYHVYAARITNQVSLCVILDPNQGSRIGAVLRYLRRAVTEIRAVVMQGFTASAPLTPPQPEPEADDTRAESLFLNPIAPVSSEWAIEETPPPPAEERVLSFEEAVAQGLINPARLKPPG